MGRFAVALSILTSALTLLVPSQAAAYPPPVAVSANAGNLVSGPSDITVGSDGAMWFLNGNDDAIGRITSNGVVTSYMTEGAFDPSNLWGLGGIAGGPDGALWITQGAQNGGSIERMTTSGALSDFTDPSIDEPGAIVAGSDGALWFTQGNDSVGRITTSGAVTTYTDPSLDDPTDIIAGPDGALWFVNAADNTIGRLTTSGSFSSFAATGCSRTLLRPDRTERCGSITPEPATPSGRSTPPEPSPPTVQKAMATTAP